MKRNNKRQCNGFMKNEKSMPRHIERVWIGRIFYWKKLMILAQRFQHLLKSAAVSVPRQPQKWKCLVAVCSSFMSSECSCTYQSKHTKSWWVCFLLQEKLKWMSGWGVWTPAKENVPVVLLKHNLILEKSLVNFGYSGSLRNSNPIYPPLNAAGIQKNTAFMRQNVLSLRAEI